MKVSPVTGKPAEASMLVNVPRLVTAYYAEVPNPSVPEQRVAFGTSGHRGSQGTKDIYKIYAESSHGADHLRRIAEEAQVIANNALAAGSSPGSESRNEHGRTEKRA
jgi:hypothetical protein